MAAATITGNVQIAITLRKEVYDLLEEMCQRENRSKSRQISWIIKQRKDAKSVEKENRIIRPPLSVWKGVV